MFKRTPKLLAHFKMKTKKLIFCDIKKYFDHCFYFYPLFLISLPEKKKTIFQTPQRGLTVEYVTHLSATSRELDILTEMSFWIQMDLPVAFAL